MKKVLLLTAVAAMVSFTSCEKERNDAANAIENGANATGDAVQDGVNATGDAVNATGDAIQDGAAATGDAFNKAYEDAKALVTDAPQIENNELQEWVNKLHDAAVKAKAAASVGNQDALNEATATMTSLSESLSNFSGDAEFSKAEAYYKEVQAELEQM
ncbi:MAG: hypothetical protein ACR2MS_11255 [Weeksellaceae bacterium]